MSEHLCHVEVKGFHTVALNEREVGIARCFADDIHRCTLAFRNFPYVFDMFLVDEQSHAFLTLVGDDFLRTECLVADGQFGHVDSAAAFLYQLRQAVEMSCRAVVVDADHGVVVALT